MRGETEIERQRLQRLVREVVFPLLYPESSPLEVAAHFVRGEPIAAEEAYAREFQPFAVGQSWGGAWSTAWFRLSGKVPEAWHAGEVVARLGLGYTGMVGFGGEGLLWEGDRPLQGVNPRHNEVTVSKKADGGEEVELFLEAAANPYHPWGGIEWPLLMPDYEGAPLYRLERADLALADRELEAAWTDLRILAELAQALGQADRRSREILHTLSAVALATDTADIRGSLLAQRELWEPLLDSPTPARSHKVTAVGHAHIDSAWLWPVRETRRKCARTFSTALALMADNPDYVFVCSQAQQHAWMAEDHPKLFGRMKEMAAAGQLEPVGSMWVEPDTNLPSGESLVRQLVFGKRFFLEHYGIETLDCWLPDAFGYSANLPQILRSAGVRYFLTQKLSWNEVDRFPHHTFWWEGIDSSRVLAHCPPTDTYNGEFQVAQLLRGVNEFAEHGLSSHSLYAFGYGDGGGGPTREMLEAYRRVRDLDPLPRVELGTAAGFFEAVERETVERDEEAGRLRPGTVDTAHAAGPGGLPVWSGELYLERHRGVQTTQAHVKLGNRRCENALREAELWSVGGLPAGDSRAELEEAWRMLLLHQFHDMLPGSSIHWVHQDSVASYARIAAVAGEVADRARGAIAARVAGLGPASVVVFNAASHGRCDLVRVPEPLLGALAETDAGAGAGLVARSSRGGDAVPVQTLAGGGLGFVASVPGSGWESYELAVERPATSPAPATVNESDAGIELSNGVVSACIAADGTLSSLRDAAGREMLAEGASGNVLQLHLDLPNDADAWDVDQGTFARAEELRSLDSLEITERGPVRVTVRIRRSFGSSRISQDVSLVAGSRRLEFETEVDWQERHRFLKAAFPLAVRAPKASFEVQFGYVERPTHANTTWDAAKFEVPAQRWADLSEPGRGLALLNDCKYGYDVRGSTMRLSLLRAPTWPDPEADKGRHRFSYAVMAHGGLGSTTDHARSVTAEAEAFNLPLRAVAAPAAGEASDLPGRGAVVSIEGGFLSSVKWADDDKGVIVRAYEGLGAHGEVAVSAGPGAPLDLATAVRTDALERDLDEPVPVTAGAAATDVRPFEMLTIRVSGRARS